MPDKAIIQKPVTKQELKDVHLYIESATKTWQALYLPKDSAGVPIGGIDANRSVTGTFSPAGDPELFQWVDRVIIPAINAAEGT